MNSGSRLTSSELGAWRGMLRVHSHIIRTLDAELIATHGLPLRSYEVLLFLKDAPSHRMRMNELSDSVLLSASGVSRLVDRLESDGFVCRERCPADGRGLYAVLTPAGAAKLQEARTTHLQGVRRHFLERLDSDELAILSHVWNTVLPGSAGP